MFIRFFIFFIFICASACQQSNKSETNCHQYFKQMKVSEIGAENLYKEAVWQVYKFNLVQGDSFKTNMFFYADSIYTETSLSEFNLEFNGFQKMADTVIFNFLFEKGVYPTRSPYYGTVIFWDDEEKIEIGDRISFVVKKDMHESKFKEYLEKNEKKLSPMLKCLVAERYSGEDKY